MTLDSPILGALAAVLAAVVVVLTRRRERAARWLIRGGTIAAVLAIAGVTIRFDRPLTIAVMVDVSPSTRGAAFRDEQSVRTRLTPLLAGRPYTLYYFADGEQPTATEPACERTRLPVPAEADAILLMSDGRFDLPRGSPPVFVVVDPALDRSGDAAVRAVVPDGDGVVAQVVTPGGRALNAVAGTAAVPLGRPTAGPGVVTAPKRLDGRNVGRIEFAPGDAWPENDALPVGRPILSNRRIAVDLKLPGFENSSGQAPSGGHAFDDASLIVMPTDADDRVAGESVSPAGIDAVLTAVRESGTTLLLVGPPAKLSTTLRRFSPLLPMPPAGPQAWTILLDASGSMGRVDAGGVRRWSAALAAAGAAVERLPGNARVTVSTFAAEVRDIASGPPAEVGRALRERSVVTPGGPTGLRGALAAVAARSAGASRVLLLTDGDADLGDASALAGKLIAAGVRLDAVVAEPSAGLQALCAATGGRATTSSDAVQWETALGRLAGVDSPPHIAVERWDGAGVLAGGELWTSRRWPGYAVEGARVLAGESRSPVAAVWNVGVGRVVSIAADVAGPQGVTSGTAWLDLAARLETQSSDSRFAVDFDERGDVVRLTAVGPDGPINAVSPRLVVQGSSTSLEAVGPGRYVAPLPRWPAPALARIMVDGHTVTRAMFGGRYAHEFDAIGNDRAALTTLAGRSGGAVIEAGDNQAIALPTAMFDRPLRPVASVTAAVLWIAAMVAFRFRPQH